MTLVGEFDRNARCRKIDLSPMGVPGNPRAIPWWNEHSRGWVIDGSLSAARPRRRRRGTPVTRTLYSGTKNASSWSFRAWLALTEQQIEFDEHVVDIRRPQRLDNLARIATFSPPGAVPVLVDDGTVIFDSLAIMEYANDIGDGSLLPHDPRGRAHARSLLAWQHAGLSGLCPRLSFESSFYPDRREMTPEEIADARRLFTVWEKELTHSGGPYLVGDLSLADLAFVPTVLRILAHAPNLADWPCTQSWAERLIGRESVEAWLKEARLLPVVRLDDYR
jgi:glutathione S-transferase